MRHRRRTVLALVAGLAATLSGGAAPAANAPPLPFGGPFALTGHDGRRVTDADFRGRFMLVFFGYTSCPDVCPLDLATMAEALDRLGALADRLQPLFVTVDPARDTVGVLREFVAAFHPRLIGLTGSEPEIAAVARAYRVHRRKVLLAPDDPLGYTIDHGSLTYLMAPDGACLTVLPHGTDADRMADVLRSYLTAGRTPP